MQGLGLEVSGSIEGVDLQVARWGREAAAAVLQRLHKHCRDALGALEQYHLLDAIGTPHAELGDVLSVRWWEICDAR